MAFMCADLRPQSPSEQSHHHRRLLQIGSVVDKIEGLTRVKARVWVWVSAWIAKTKLRTRARMNHAQTVIPHSLH